MKRPVFNRSWLNFAKRHGSMRRRQEYFNYQLVSCRKYMNKVSLIAAAFNQILLIPDMMFVNNMTGKLITAFLRTVFTGILILFSLYYSKARVFHSFYRLVSAVEFLDILLFLFITEQYGQPNFMIQVSGLYVILLSIFFFPNRYRNMLILSFLVMAAFLALAWRETGGFNANELFVSILYFLATILICSIFALGRDRQQYREFIVKNRLMKMSYTDQLTKVSNRNKLLAEFAKWQKKCKEQGQSFCMALFDIDQFKSINDRFGHTMADDVLVELAKTIRPHLRSTDLLVRWGGDEFVILLPQTTRKDAVKVLNRIRFTVENKQFVGKIHITCSFGLADTEGDATLETMLQQADNLMYEGKKQGGNRVIFQEVGAALQSDA